MSLTCICYHIPAKIFAVCTKMSVRPTCAVSDVIRFAIDYNFCCGRFCDNPISIILHRFCFIIFIDIVYTDALMFVLNTRTVVTILTVHVYTA